MRRLISPSVVSRFVRVSAHIRIVATIADLRALTPGVYAPVYVQGYRTQGIGGGIFNWDASNGASDDSYSDG